MSIKYFPLNWVRYSKFVDKLALKILNDNQSFDKIVGISRCGLTLGHLLSDYLQKQVAILAIQSYTGIETRQKPRLLGHLSMPINKEKVLLVDGISDSGKTLTKAIDYLKKEGPRSITTATLFYKPHSIFRPDYYVKETSDWILFPYEATEWILAFTKSMLKEGKKKKEIHQFLSRLGYTQRQISNVYKHYL